MSLFKFLKSTKTAPKSEELKNLEGKLEESQKAAAADNAAIKAMLEADKQYKEDGDLDKVIAVYEPYLREKTRWDSFNFNMRLAKYYLKAGRNDKAWGKFNQMLMDAMDPLNFPLMFERTAKINREQYKMVKKEKRYMPAIDNLTSYYAYKSLANKTPVFDREKFIHEAWPLMKKMGVSENDFAKFTNDLERIILTEDAQGGDTYKLCSNFYEELKLS